MDGSAMEVRERTALPGEPRPRQDDAAHRDAPLPSGPVKVVYIAGRGRSGSTLLDSVLGQTPGFFSAGELALGGRRLANNDFCGCRSPIRECAVWSDALQRAFGDLKAAEAAMSDAFAIGRRGSDWLTTLAGGRNAPFLRRRHREALERLPALYLGLAQATGARAIVDSSKSPIYASALSLLPQIDLYVLHLVRDPRAVAYSWLRQAKSRPRSADPLHRRNFGVAGSSWRWAFVNLTTDVLLRRLGERYRVLRYEDFVSDPARTLEQILAWIGEPAPAPASLARGRLQLAPGHTISGNPSRFRTGEVTLELDDEWRRAMPAAQRRLASILTWPLRARYGYAD